MDDLIDVNNELQEVEEVNMGIIRNPKIYLDRINPLDTYTEEQFKTHYRMRKAVARQIIALIKDSIIHYAVNKRGLEVSADIQFLATVRYLAKGAYGTDIAEQHGISQPTLSLIIKRVVEAICAHRVELIKFPQEEELKTIKQDFYAIGQCPNIVGAIDCTHVKIKNPGGEHPLTYINRKCYYSLNVQVVCDAKLRMRDIVARWRGSTHDSRIWNQCLLKRKFDENQINGILLGDNGYPLSKFLLTPFLNPATRQQTAYIRAHILTRNVVERCFGIMKNKFRCLFNGLNLHIATTKAAIIAIAIIHNCIINDKLENGGKHNYVNKMHFFPDIFDDENFEGNNEDHGNEILADNLQANAFRNLYANSHF